MADGSQQRYAEPMTMSNVEAYVYEAIATAEQAGHSATRTEIAPLSDLDDRTLDDTLHAMTSRGLVTVEGDIYRAVRAPLPPGQTGGHRDL